MTNIKDLPYLAKIGIVALVILLLTACAYVYALQPLEKANQADELTLKSKQAEIAQLTPYKAKLAELNAQAAALKQQMEEQSKIVPEQKEVPSFITMVEAASVASGVEVRSYSPKSTAAKEYYVEVPFEVELDGPFYDVMNFFNRIQKLDRIVNVSKLTMHALKSGAGGGGSYRMSPDETVTAKCMLTTFYSNPKETNKPVAGKAKKQGRP
jgi:type IV pilus assembly protein PilO